MFPRIKAYLAGPDVFLPDAVSHASRKVAICAEYGIEGVCPLNEAAVRLASMSDVEFAHSIFHKDLSLMDQCDILIANLTPFRSVSADSGTLVELGYFLGRGKPTFGYTNNSQSFADRCKKHLLVLPDEITGLTLEGLGMPDNLMIPGAILHGGGLTMTTPPQGMDLPFDSLQVFQLCVSNVAAHLHKINKDKEQTQQQATDSQRDPEQH